MKRSLLFTFAIAIAVAAIVSLSHARGWLASAELPLANSAAKLSTPAHFLDGIGQYSLIVLLSLATAWITITSGRRHRIIWLVVSVIAELLALMWICALYRIFFQPLPCILAVILGYGGALGYLAVAGRKRGGIPLTLFNGKLSEAQIARLRSGDVEFDGSARAFETSVVVCDLANKYDLADSDDPGLVAQASEKFTARAAELLRNAGAYLHAADGEGVVAVFGFPANLTDHAEKAVRAAFDLSRAFAETSNSSNGENVSTACAHVGVSTGSVIAAPTEEKQDFFVMGEPVELARRFCVANRFYGSRILIGPRTFELANSTIVARPIDFLSGVNAQERHEIYEPLAFAADAPNELVARRDSFWNGVVLYREKRWAEAYSEFQKARGPENEEDAPLNLYLRRLEPLALHLMETQAK